MGTGRHYLNGNMENIMNNIHMNQLCKVCNEPAAGFHFGAFTCEGCKSFFGRTYNNVSGVSECKNGGRCEITKKNRTSCKSCRLRKCLSVGMSKSGSRYGRRSNWFKIHCLLSAQSQSQNGVGGMSSSAPTSATNSTNSSSASISPPETNNNNSSLLNNNNNNSRIHNSQSSNKALPSSGQTGQMSDIDRSGGEIHRSSSRHHHSNNHYNRHSSSRERSGSTSSSNNTLSSSHRMSSNNSMVHPPFPNHLASLSPNSKEQFLASFAAGRKNNPSTTSNPEVYDYFRMAAAAAAAQAAVANANNGSGDDDGRTSLRSPGSLESPANSESGSITDEIHKPGLFGLPGSPLEQLKPNDLLSFDLLTRDLMKLGYDPLRLWPAMLSASAQQQQPPSNMHPHHQQVHHQFNPYARFMLPSFPGPGITGFPSHLIPPPGSPLLNNLPSSILPPNSAISNGNLIPGKHGSTPTPPTLPESPHNHHHHHHHHHQNRRFPTIPMPLTAGSGGSGASSLTLTPPISHHGDELVVPKFTKSHKYAPVVPAAVPIQDGPIDLSAKTTTSTHNHHHHYQNKSKKYNHRYNHHHKPSAVVIPVHPAAVFVKNEVHHSSDNGSSSDFDDVNADADEPEEDGGSDHIRHSPSSVSSSASAHRTKVNTANNVTKSDLSAHVNEAKVIDGDNEEQSNGSSHHSSASAKDSAIIDTKMSFNDESELPHDLSRNSSPHNNNNNNTIIKSEFLGVDSGVVKKHHKRRHHHRVRHASCSSSEGSGASSSSSCSNRSGANSAGSKSSVKKAKLFTTPLDLTQSVNRSNSSSSSCCSTTASNPPTKIST